MYGCKDVPIVKISLMKNDEIVYSFTLEYLNYYFERFNTTNGDFIIMTSALFNPKDYAVLISQSYDKYIVESHTKWLNSETIEDEDIEHPVKVFKYFEIQNELNGENGDPTEWTLTFKESL